jgi:hypothetical protein
MKEDKIRINPCSENWDAMTPTEQGRHCTKCVKNVHDVSHLTDQEIWNKYEDNNGSMCIRIPKSRLQPIKRPRRQQLKYVAVTAIILWFSTIKNNLMAQVTSPQIENITDKNVIDKMTIKGTVRDTAGTDQLVAYATILLTINDIRVGGAYSDENGTFTLEINNTIKSTDKIRLTVKYLGYLDTKKEVNFLRDTIDCNVYVKDNHICLNENLIMTQSNDMLQGEITLGIMLRTNEIIKKDANIKTFKSDEIERYNLGR